MGLDWQDVHTGTGRSRNSIGSSIPRGIDSGRGTGCLVLMLASPKRCKNMQSS